MTAPLRLRRWFAVCGCWALLVGSALAQRQESETISGFAPQAPLLKARPPRPLLGPDGVMNYVNGITSHEDDAVIEVVIGRPRILTLKDGFSPPGSTTIVALGDPTIADLDILSRSQVRILGYIPGDTNLIFVPPAPQPQIPARIRVQVRYDLDDVRKYLGETFPGVAFHISQTREHLVVQAQTPDVVIASLLPAVLNAYQLSMQERMRARPQITGTQTMSAPTK